MDRTMKFLIILFLLWAVLFVWVKTSDGFTTGGSSKNIYLQNNESIYVMRRGIEFLAYVYKYDPVTGEYTGQWVRYMSREGNSITIHFIEPTEEVCTQVKSSTVE